MGVTATLLTALLTIGILQTMERPIIQATLVLVTALWAATKQDRASDNKWNWNNLFNKKQQSRKLNTQRVRHGLRCTRRHQNVTHKSSNVTSQPAHNGRSRAQTKTKNRTWSTMNNINQRRNKQTSTGAHRIKGEAHWVPTMKASNIQTTPQVHNMPSYQVAINDLKFNNDWEHHILNHMADSLQSNKELKDHVDLLQDYNTSVHLLILQLEHRLDMPGSATASSKQVDKTENSRKESVAQSKPELDDMDVTIDIDGNPAGSEAEKGREAAKDDKGTMDAGIERATAHNTEEKETRRYISELKQMIKKSPIDKDTLACYIMHQGEIERQAETLNSDDINTGCPEAQVQQKSAQLEDMMADSPIDLKTRKCSNCPLPDKRNTPEYEGDRSRRQQKEDLQITRYYSIEGIDKMPTETSKINDNVSEPNISRNVTFIDEGNQLYSLGNDQWTKRPPTILQMRGIVTPPTEWRGQGKLTVHKRKEEIDKNTKNNDMEQDSCHTKERKCTKTEQTRKRKRPEIKQKAIREVNGFEFINEYISSGNEQQHSWEHNSGGGSDEEQPILSTNKENILTI